jgi:hypothetical protein
MILTPHILVGAAIGSKIKNPLWVFLIAFFSHFILDMIPHAEYDVSVLKEKLRFNKKFICPFFEIIIDLIIGFGILWFSTKFFFFKKISTIYIGAISGIIPDAFTILYWQTNNKIFKALTNFHVFHSRKISRRWGIITEIAVSLLAIFVFLY